MGGTNTTKIGNALEDRAYALINELLAKDEFISEAKKSKVLKKKRYYSHKRQGYITTDMAVEVWMPKAKNPSQIIVIECKNYNDKHKISIDDIQKFSVDLHEIGAHNTKGIIICNCEFQKGAFNFARATGIGIIRMSENGYKWIVHRKEKQARNYNAADFDARLASGLADDEFIAWIDEQPITSMTDVLFQLRIITQRSKQRTIPYRDEKYISSQILDLLKFGIYDVNKLNMDKLCQILEKKYQISFDLDTVLTPGTLGKIELNPLKISVSKEIFGDPKRFRFTLAHEIGHLILHRDILEEYKSVQTNSNTLDSNYDHIDEVINLLETQANKFASHLLMPTEFVKRVVAKYFWENNISKNYLYWDNQHVNRRLVHNLLSALQIEFYVSREAAQIRLEKLGLLVTKTYRREEFKTLSNYL